MQFSDRKSAGQLLAQRLAHLAGRSDVIVLALPRGGLPVGYEVAQSVRAPLDIFVVRKLGVPGQDELAMGAIASGGVRILNRQVIEALGISEPIIARVAAREQPELERRELVYRQGRPPLEVTGKTVVLVDDGIATGSSMRAAIEAVRHLGAARVIVATPVMSRGTALEMRPEVDDLVAVLTPEEFLGVGQWYEDFAQTTDAEVKELLERAGGEPKPTQSKPQSQPEN